MSARRVVVAVTASLLVVGGGGALAASQASSAPSVKPVVTPAHKMAPRPATQSAPSGHQCHHNGGAASAAV